MNIIHYLRKKYGIETKVDHYYTLTVEHRDPFDEKETMKAMDKIRKILEKHPHASVYVAQNVRFYLKETDDKEPHIRFPMPETHAMFSFCEFYNDIMGGPIVDFGGDLVLFPTNKKCNQ